LRFGEERGQRLRREVIDILPRFLAKDGVVAVGEIGFDAMTAAEEEALRTCGERGRPFGGEGWVRQTAEGLGLQSSLRPRGRPRKEAQKS